MRVLVDTHVWLWLLTDPGRIAPAALSLLADPDHELLLSAASAWEIGIKHALGKLPLPEPPEVFVPRRLAATDVQGLPVRVDHAVAVSSLPLHHRDPFDRLLVAQAQLEALTLCTADAAFDAYDVRVLSAR